MLELVALLLTIPKSVRERFGTVAAKVFGAAAAPYIAEREGKAALIAAEYGSRIEQKQAITKAVKTKIPSLANSSEDFTEIVARSLNYQAEKMFRDQSNREQVIKKSVNYINGSAHGDISENRMNEDWVSIFLESVSNFSDPDMQDIFSRILAGEISQPGSFSTATIRSVASLNKKLASIFEKMCCVSIDHDGGALILQLDFEPIGQSGFEKFGFRYIDVMALIDIGLIRPQFIEYINFMDHYIKNCNEPILFDYCGELHEINLIDTDNLPNPRLQRLDCMSFTAAGAELRRAISLERNPEYFDRFSEFFSGIGCKVENAKDR